MAKCQKCNGDGKERNYFGVIIGVCPRCYGTGEAKPITNEEFLRTATTEQLAEEIVNLTLLDKYKLYDQMESAEYDIGIGVGAKKVIVEWLNQPHTFE